MSEPARQLQRPSPGWAPPRPPRPPRVEPRTRPRPSLVRRPAATPGASRRSTLVARRSGTVGFLILSTVVVGSMVLGVVALNALLAQSSFRVDDLEQRMAALSQEHLELVHEQATLSAPGRIAAWARRHGMRLPDDIRFLHVPPAGRTAPAGAADALDRLQRTVSNMVGGGE